MNIDDARQLAVSAQRVRELHLRGVLQSGSNSRGLATRMEAQRARDRDVLGVTDGRRAAVVE